MKRTVKSYSQCTDAIDICQEAAVVAKRGKVGDRSMCDSKYLNLTFQLHVRAEIIDLGSSIKFQTSSIPPLDVTTLVPDLTREWGPFQPLSRRLGLVP